MPANKYVTFFLAALDPGSGHLDYVNAGHNPPILVRGDGRGRDALGGRDGAGPVRGRRLRRGAESSCDPGDTLVVFSDGVTETWDPDGEEFGEEGLLPFVVRSRALDAEALQNAILREIEGFEAGARATDDRTIVVLKRD